MAASYTVLDQEQQQHTVVLRIPSGKMAGVPAQEDRSEPSFWTILAQKAKSVLMEDDSQTTVNDLPARTRSRQSAKDGTSVVEQSPAMKLTAAAPVHQASMGKPLQKGLGAIASSLSLIGDTLGTAIEEGFHLIDGKSASAKNGSPEVSKSLQKSPSIWKQVQDVQARQSVQNAGDSGPGDVQLKASRDVAMAMASKAKGLLRELKTVKAEQTFLRNRCTELEEENRQLREGAFQGDDFVRQQLESLLAEKQRLAQENANYARENQLLHEVVEYHHLTLQDVAFLDDRFNGETEGFSPRASETLIPRQLSFRDAY